MPPEPRVGATSPRSPACEDLVTRTATQIDADNERIALHLVARIADEVDLVRDDEDVREDLLSVARACAALLTAMTRSWADPHVVPPPKDAVQWARGLVARGLPMDAVLRVFRLGQATYREVWHEALAASDEPPEVIFEALRVTSTFTFAWVDAILQPLATIYEEERERTLRGAHAVHAETVSAILSGDRIDAQVASARLGYELGRNHLAIIAWVDARADEGSVEYLENLATTAASGFATDAARPLVLRTASRVVFAWVPRGTAGDAQVQQVRERLRGTGVRIAVGRPAGGVEGFRASHDDALRARRVARLLRGTAPVTRYEDVAVTDLLTRDPDAARAMARATLGPLAADDDASRRLLATLRVFFQEGQNFARAARRLNIHENTVAYRVRRSLELTGQTDVDSLVLRAAVEIVPMLDAVSADDVDA